MNVAVLIILIVVGGIILWGALTGWTFSGIFGGAGGDSPPAPITNVQVGVATGEGGGRRESYTTPEKMDGLSITISFNTPRTFGRGDLALRDYVISMGITGNDERGNLLAVIYIPRNAATGGTRLITGNNNGVNKDIFTSQGIALSGDFNVPDSQVKITLYSPLWRDGGITIPQRDNGDLYDVYLGIDYTPMKLTADYAWPGVQKFNTPAGVDTRTFLSDTGVTLIGQLTEDVGFVVDPDVTASVNNQLDIELEKFEEQDDIVEGDIEIAKQIGMSSRFVISPSHIQDIFLGFPKGGKGIKAAILGEPGADCILNTCRAKPSVWTDNITDKIRLGWPGVQSSEFWNPENWFNFVIMERHTKSNGVLTGWVSLGLVSKFEKRGDSGNAITIKRAKFPVIHPVHQMDKDDEYLSFHASDPTPGNKTYFKFVSPLDSSDPQGGKKFSLCVRRVKNDNSIDTNLSKDLTAEDLFLRYWGWGSAAKLQRLKDIDDLSMAVFTKRRPDSGPVDLVCDPTASVYDPRQEEGDNYLTFKNSCGTSDIVGEVGFGITACTDNYSGVIKPLCDGTPGCIGYRTFGSSGCSRHLMNTPPVCRRYSGQVYGKYDNKALNASTGKLVGAQGETIYMNGLCYNDPDATYRKWGDDPLNPVGGGCSSTIDVHKAACSANPHCVGFHLQTNNCSHFLRKKALFEMPPDLTVENGDAAMSKSFWGGNGHELDADTVEECEQQAKARGAPAYVVRTKDHNQQWRNTCYALPNDWSGGTPHPHGMNSHYTACTDPSKKVKNACKY